MVLSLFEQPLFANIILPFLLVFTIVFAVLQKTKLLGQDNKAIDVIISLVIGIVFIGVPAVAGVTIKFIPIVAVIVVLIFGLMLMFGISGISQGEGAFQFHSGIKITLGIVIGIAFIITILWATGTLQYIIAVKEKWWASQLWQTLIFIGLLVGVIIALVVKGKNK